jgi:hypothetical protein
MHTLTRRLTAWIACFAVLLAALAPSISHAISAAAGGDTGWVEICSLAGARLVNVDDEVHPSPSIPVEKGFHFDHCPFCSMHGGTVGLLPTVGFTLPVAGGEPVLPSLFYQSPRPLFVWAAAHSRAPPAAS